jgi:hypothetical protein
MSILPFKSLKYSQEVMDFQRAIDNESRLADFKNNADFITSRKWRNRAVSIIWSEQWDNIREPLYTLEKNTGNKIPKGYTAQKYNGTEGLNCTPIITSPSDFDDRFYDDTSIAQNILYQPLTTDKPWPGLILLYRFAENVIAAPIPRFLAGQMTQWGLRNGYFRNQNELQALLVKVISSNRPLDWDVNNVQANQLTYKQTRKIIPLKADKVSSTKQH